MYFDYMATIAGILYCLGIYLHFIHVHTVFYLLERDNDMDRNRTLFHSLVWPWTVVQFIWFDIVGEEDDDEDKR